MQKTISHFILGFFLSLFFSSILIGQNTSPCEPTYIKNQIILDFPPEFADEKIEELQHRWNAEPILYSIQSSSVHLWQIKFPFTDDEITYNNVVDILNNAQGRTKQFEVDLNYILCEPTSLDDLTEQFCMDTYNPFHFCGLEGTNTSSVADIDVKVAMIDSGFEDSFKGDFVNRGFTIENGVDFIEGHSSSSDDDCGHGTAVAATMMGTLLTHNTTGVTILPIKVINSDCGGTLYDLIRGVDYASSSDANIINISLGYTPVPEDKTAILESLLQKVTRNNKLVVVAAGNSGQFIDENNQVLPTGFENMDNFLAVGAVECGGSWADFSNYNNAIVDIAAPGSDILIPTNDGSWALANGTSYAAPIVSAMAARWFAQNNSATLTEDAIINEAISNVDLQSKVVSSGQVKLELSPSSELSNCNSEPPLFIELKQFTAELLANQQVLIEWITLQEKDNLLFKIQHSSDGKEWKTIGTRTGQKNSTVNTHYELTHQEPSKGRNFYRLLQLDKSGKQTILFTQSVYVEKRNMFHLYPNPIQDYLFFDTPIDFEGQVYLSIRDIQGQEVFATTIDFIGSTYPINLSYLHSGIYFISLTSEKHQYTVKVLKE